MLNQKWRKDQVMDANNLVENISSHAEISWIVAYLYTPHAVHIFWRTYSWNWTSCGSLNIACHPGDCGCVPVIIYTDMPLMHWAGIHVDRGTCKIVLLHNVSFISCISDPIHVAHNPRECISSSLPLRKTWLSLYIHANAYSASFSASSDTVGDWCVSSVSW